MWREIGLHGRARKKLMDPFYLEIRAIHIGAVLASGSLFLLRALAFNLFGARWAMARPLRRLAYVIDTVLLAAALTLLTIVRQYPFVDAWLTAKVVLLVVYIALGIFALRAATRTRRIGFMLAATATYLLMISIARAHDPLGLFQSGRIW